MSDEKEYNDKADQAAALPAPARSGTARTALLMSLIALIATISLGYYLLVMRGLNEDRPPAGLADMQHKLQTLRDSHSSFNVTIEEIQARQQTLTETLRQNTRYLGKNRVLWTITEVEQLMIVANQRLQLAGDADTALTALTIADERLNSLADPDLLPVRRELAREIAALKSMERIDRSGIALRLMMLAEGVEALPISLELRRASKIDQPKPAPAPIPKTEAEAKAQESNIESRVAELKQKGFFEEFWEDLKGLVTIRAHVESYKPLLPPEQQYFLRENLRLMLLGAQQAALNGDVATYTRNLEAVRRWTRRHFDLEAAPIRHLLDESAALLKLKLATKPPVISGSLKTLRDIRANIAEK